MSDDGNDIQEPVPGRAPAHCEIERVQILNSYGILDTVREDAFDDIVRLAAALLQAPIAIINFVGSDRQWFKAEIGIGCRELPLDDSICRFAILQPGVFVVPDLTQDPRFGCNPLVHVEDGLRFYAGALLTSPEGMPLGTICVLDREPRADGITQWQREGLEALASQVMTLLERHVAGRHQRFLTKVTKGLQNASAASVLIDDAVEALARYLGVAQSGFCEFESDQNHLVVRSVWSDGRVSDVEGRWQLSAFGPALRDAIRTEPVLVVSNVANDGRTRDPASKDMFAAINVRSFLNVPIVRNGKAVAMLFNNHFEPRYWAKSEIEHIQEFVGRVWVAYERARAVERASERAAELAAIYDAAPVGLCVLDRELHFLRCNERLAEINGISAEEHIGKTVREIVPDMDEQVRLAIENVLQDKPMLNIEMSGTTQAQPGVVRSWRTNWLPLRGLSDEIVGITVSAEEITLEKRAQQQRRDEARRKAFVLDVIERLRDDLDTALVGVCELVSEELGVARVGFGEVKADETLLQVNVEASRHSAVAAIGTHRLVDFGSGLLDDLKAGRTVVIDDVETDDRTAANLAAHRKIQTRSLLTIPLLEQGRLRATFYLNHDSVRAWRAHEIALATDVAAQSWAALERSRAEAALTASEAMFRTTAEALPGMIFVTSAEGRNTYVNSGFCEYTGRPIEDLLSDRWTEVIHPDDIEMGWEIWRAAVASRKPYVAEYRFRRHDGAWRWHMVRGLPIIQADGSVTNWVGTCTDIHERRALEEELQHRVEERTATLVAIAQELEAEMARREAMQAQLLQAQKMEALGQLVGGVAHDFNNILAAIQSAFHLLDRHVDGDLKFIVGEGAKAGQRAHSLVRQMLAFARREPAQMGVVDLAVALGETREMLCQAVGPMIDCTVDADPDLWPVLLDRQQFEVALLNLAINARDAMPSGGRLTISARNLGGHDPRPPALGSGDHVIVEVCDTGAGMDAATLARVFEPFFTTKATGKGTGLGLAQVHGVVAAAGGTIDVSSQPDRGTTFRLYLPRSAIRQEQVRPYEDIAPKPTRATILLVDDDAQVRPVTAALLRDLGYTVVEAANAPVATALAGLHPFDLLLTDVVMPEVDGPTLATRLRAIRPGLPVVYVTGFAHGRDLADSLVLPKPYSVEELQAVLTTALAS